MPSNTGPNWALSWRNHDGERSPATVTGEMKLGGQPSTAASEPFVGWVRDPFFHRRDSADVHDTVSARKLLGGLAPLVPRLQKIWADAAYRGKELAEWCRQQGG